MANIALEKKILESGWKKPDELTNNDFKNYDGSHGFTHAPWPNYLTLDLENIFDIQIIRFLLWDKDIRAYYYRLLTSVDLKTWMVQYDTIELGYQGWQEFNFINKIKARYIRIHCLRNSRNEEFHIVQMQVYEDNTDIQDMTISNKKVITRQNDETIIEIGNGLPLTQQIKKLTNSLENIINENSIINPIPFQEIIKNFRIQARDIEALELSLDSIRREIINPVQKELEEGKKLGRFSVWGFYIGFLGILVSIFAILNGVFKWI